MEQYDIGIIGAGAAGIVAAVSAKYHGASVVLCERMLCMGKKLLVTGGGKCNLLNEQLTETAFGCEAHSLVRSIFSQFGKDKIVRFFEELGVLISTKEDHRMFPVTQQAQSVVTALELEVKRLGVQVSLGFEVVHIIDTQNGFTVISRDGKKIFCSKLIVAGGGKTYPALGSNGSCYQFAEQYGHSISKPIPVAVPIVVKDQLCHRLQGQKIQARVQCFINDKLSAEADGDVLFTQYGLSGTAILDISSAVSRAIHRTPCVGVIIVLDVVPSLNQTALLAELEKRKKRGMSPEMILTGIVPNKWSQALREVLSTGDNEALVMALKQKHFTVTGTRGWNEAEFTYGGVSPREIQEGTLESLKKKKLYFAGEMIDVEGKRGGYNLAWAWASGWIAGQTK